MKLETFFEKFDQFADAPDAVAKMRELVLELAVQGRLTSALPRDDAVPSVIEFRESAAALTNSLGLRSPKESVEEAEPPFDVPSHWRWLALADIGAAQTGTTPSKADHDAFNGDVPFIKPADILPNSIDYSNESLTRHGVESGSRLAPSGSLLMVCIGTIGKCNLIERECAFNQQINSLTPVDAVDSRYLLVAARSRSFQDAAWKKSSSTTIAILNKGKWLSIPVPLPPLAEQKRIVAKVDELMALCDRLEAQQQERETRHAALARASLARFADAPTPANLPFLFHPAYAIPPADLRRSILTLAVQGKLVPQDPNDELAEELIARIATMRHAKKAKQYDAVPADEMAYEVPFSWAWVRLGNIALTSDSGWSPQCLPEARSGNDWGVLKVSAVSWGVFKPEENKALPPGMTSRPDCEVKGGDFLLSRANTEELVARSVVVDQTPPRLMMSDKIVRFTFPEEIERAFINLANTSDPSRAYYARNASGTSSSMKNIGREVMCNLPIPFPPLAEQRRIVAKLEQLMALVDALETQLAASRATAANLLSAFVAELTAV